MGYINRATLVLTLKKKAMTSQSHTDRISVWLLIFKSA